MNNVDRSRIKLAARRLVDDPSLLDHMSEGAKLRYLREQVFNYKLGGCELVDVENALAWSLFFDVVK